jgi:hypothetical protein
LAAARGLIQAGKVAEAEAALSLLLRRDPGCAAAFNDRGCLRVDLGDLGDALLDFAEAMRLEPDLARARQNFQIASRLVTRAEQGSAPVSTVTAALVQASREGGSFAEALLGFLREAVSVPPGHEERREDAIQEVALRVLQRSRSDDLPLAEALLRLRRSSTRAWVRKLLGTSRRKSLAPLPEEMAAPSARGEPGRPLGLDACLEAVKEGLVASSQPATRWRRRIVWDVFVGSLLEGVRLTRAEVVEAVRALKVSRHRARDTQILADLDLISATLRRSGPPPPPA